MINKDELREFKKMWTWLMAYPAHDRKYYMRYVAALGITWPNNCPLSDSVRAEDCSGCQLLWDSEHGTLCTDPDAPLSKWKNTEKSQPDQRSLYASQVAVLAMRLKKQLEREGGSPVLRRKAA